MLAMFTLAFRESNCPVGSRQSSQGPGVKPIVFPTVLSDQAHVSRIGRSDFRPGSLNHRLTQAKTSLFPVLSRCKAFPSKISAIVFEIC
jgi:hypothetical protein